MNSSIPRRRMIKNYHLEDPSEGYLEAPNERYLEEDPYDEPSLL